MDNRNNLYPIFLKVSQLDVLIVGGGAVGHEKLSFLLKSSPNARVELVAETVLPEIEKLAEEHHVSISKRSFLEQDLDNRHLVIAATDVSSVNRNIFDLAKRRHLLVNVADTPDLCDFYLGGIVTKGHLKVAISTNGQSPTMAKRFRQLLEETLPDSSHDLLINLNQYRQTLKDDFQYKVDHLNQLTESFISKN